VGDLQKSFETRHLLWGRDSETWENPFLENDEKIGYVPGLLKITIALRYVGVVHSFSWKRLALDYL
jgi:hypothetical protein